MEVHAQAYDNIWLVTDVLISETFRCWQNIQLMQGFDSVIIRQFLSNWVAFIC